mgnify:CR=1 FL=1
MTEVKKYSTEEFVEKFMGESTGDLLDYLMVPYTSLNPENGVKGMVYLVEDPGVYVIQVPDEVNDPDQFVERLWKEWYTECGAYDDWESDGRDEILGALRDAPSRDGKWVGEKKMFMFYPSYT